MTVTTEAKRPAAVSAPGIVLPTKKSPALTKSPKTLVIFSKPKVGKTSLLAGLENCLILDLENGTDYLEAMKLKVSSAQDIKPIVSAIIEAGKPYKYIAIDTMGKNWFTEGKPKYGSILNLPNGAGYPWLREAFTRAIELIRHAADNIILIGHIKDTLLEKNGAEFSALDLDLTGKLKRITTSNADAIGYLYRKGDKNFLSFKTTDEISCGARPEHLRNKEFVISEVTDSGLVTHWDEIYID
jgi:hypothetical protein